MRILSHFAIGGMSNTYIIGPDHGGDAILIDPSRFDAPLLNLIEDNNYYIRWVLATHDHDNHVRGLKTLLKIYDAEVFGACREISGIPAKELKDNVKLILPHMEILPLEIRGHSSDSLVYSLGNSLFTGDILSAGRIGRTNTTWARANMVKDLVDKLFVLPKESILYPGHGPLSTLEIESLTNGDLRQEQEQLSR